MDLPLTELQGMGGLPGLEMQFVMTMLCQLFLASLRIGSFLLASPLFGGSFVPVQVRVVMGILLGVSVMGMVDVPPIETLDQMKLIGVIITEIAIGVSAGLILTIWFSAATLAGEKIATSAGLGYAAQMDPDSGGQTPIVSKMLQMFLIQKTRTTMKSFFLFDLIRKFQQKIMDYGFQCQMFLFHLLPQN